MVRLMQEQDELDIAQDYSYNNRMAKIKEQYIPYKVLYSFEERRQKYKQTTQSFIAKGKTNLVLIILEPHPKSKLPILDNCRYCCEAQQPLNYLRDQIWNKKLQLGQHRSLFLYCGKVVLVGDQSIGALRQQYKDEDGFLYITYAEMDVF